MSRSNILPAHVYAFKAQLQDILLRITAFRLRGTKYHCPVCGFNAKRFNPLSRVFLVTLHHKGKSYTPDKYETVNIENFTCPNCVSADKVRLFALYLDKFLEKWPKKKKLNLLHFAPERALTKFLKKYSFINYRTADLLMPIVDDRVDITNMKNYASNSFDIFICSHVLEHVQDDRRAMKELYRILKPTGFGIIMCPIMTTLKQSIEDETISSESDRLIYFGQIDHVRVYSKSDFIQRLKCAGFIVHQYGKDYFGSSVFARCGITKGSVLYVVSKK